MLFLWHHSTSYHLLVQQRVMTLHPWLLNDAQGIMPLCIESYIISWANFIAVASSWLIQVTNHDIVPIALQVASHKALHLFSFIKKGVRIMPNAISTIGYISLHVVELMHGCRKRLPYVPCSCQRPYTKAPWYGHALVIMSHLEAWYIVLFGCLTKYLLFNTYITIYVRDEAPWMLQWIHLNL